MSHFCLLKEPDSYAPNQPDLLADAEAREYWFQRFGTHFDNEIVSHAQKQFGPGAYDRIEEAAAEFKQAIDDLRGSSDHPGASAVIELGHRRQQILREKDLEDPYLLVKEQENTSAIELYPEVLNDLQSIPRDETWIQLVEACLAGNVFDLGNATEFGKGGREAFLASFENLAQRPWLIDDFDRFEADLIEAGAIAKWSKGVAFVDNAGCDFVLGLLPLVRELALHGTQIVLAANTYPVLNDLTADDTYDLLQRLAILDDELNALLEGDMITVTATGSDLAILDLSDVSDELNQAAADAELVILEGMGRALETNLDVPFKVDALRLAMVKDPFVAERLGGKLRDCVCKYTTVADKE
jgi:uncharacterized protein with ATP-grasp and redox domains